MVASSLGEDTERGLIELGEMLDSAKKEERREAVYQLQKQGPAAAVLVPQLAEALSDSDDQVWHGATMTLAAIGPEAAGAIPQLIRQMGGGGARYREQRRHRSAYALSCIGEAALPALLEALEDDDAHRRWGGLHALGLLGEPAYDSIDRMVPLLGDEEEMVRLEAREACVALGEVCLPRVAGELVDASAEMRESAAVVLRRFGVRGKAYRNDVTTALLREETTSPVRGVLLESAAAVGADPEFLASLLVETLLEGAEEQQDAVFNAITAHPAIARECVPTLGLLLHDASASRRALAASLLGRLGSEALPAAPPLVDQLAGGAEPDEVERYLNALILIGPGVLPAVLEPASSISPADLDEAHWMVRVLRGLAPLTLEEMEGLLPGASPTVACAILQSLPRYNRRNRAVEKEVMALTSHAEAALRMHAVTMLCRIPVPEKVWLRAERRALKDLSPQVRAAALAALRHVPMANEERVQILMAGIEADEREVRLVSVEELGQLGALAKPAVPVLLASAQGPSPVRSYRAAVVKALGEIGEGAKEAVPFLIGLLDDASAGGLRTESLQALASMEKAAQPALPMIEELLGSKDAELRQAALGAYASIETDAEKLIPVYLTALEDPSAEVRRPVIDGLGRLGERGEPAAEALVDLLDSEPDRRPALEALREIRSQSVSLCLRMLDHDSPSVRLLACDHLGRIRSEEAVPALRKAMRDEYSFVRRRAREALERIERGDRRRQ